MTKRLSPDATCPSAPPLKIQAAFFAGLAPLSQLRRLFDHLNGVHFFMKNLRSEFMAADRDTLNAMGFTEEAQLIGKTDFDLYPREMAEGFVEGDQKVITSGEPLLNLREVWSTQAQSVDWVSTNKFPLWGTNHKIVGVMGTVQSLQYKQATLLSHARISPAVQHMQAHFHERLAMPELCRLSGLSERQLRRQFHEAFGMSPQEFLLTTRLQAACKALQEDKLPISEIATTTGFSDQSSFSMHFRRALAVTPLQFRRLKKASRS